MFCAMANNERLSFDQKMHLQEAQSRIFQASAIPIELNVVNPDRLNRNTYIQRKRKKKKKRGGFKQLNLEILYFPYVLLQNMDFSVSG